MTEVLAATNLPVSSIISGDMNTDCPIPGFISSLAVYKDNGGDADELYSVSETPPTPVNFEGGCEKFLESRKPMEFDYEHSRSWAIDHIFGYDSECDTTRRAELSNVERVMLHFRGSTEAERLTENNLVWLEHWNDVWRHAEDGVEQAKRTAKQLCYNVISDHFPITAQIKVDFSNTP